MRHSVAVSGIGCGLGAIAAGTWTETEPCSIRCFWTISINTPTSLATWVVSPPPPPPTPPPPPRYHLVPSLRQLVMRQKATSADIAPVIYVAHQPIHANKNHGLQHLSSYYPTFCERMRALLAVATAPLPAVFALPEISDFRASLLLSSCFSSAIVLTHSHRQWPVFTVSVMSVAA